MLEEHRSHAAEIQASVDSITTEIQHLHKKLEDQGATLTSVNQNTTETNANVKIIAQDLKDLKDLMEQINARERNTVPIPVLRMEVSSQNISNDDARKFHQIVVDGSNINVGDEQWRRIVKEFQIAKNGIANESGVNSREVTETRFECIAMYIQCWTLNGILKLCEDCLSGKLSEIFKPVERELRKIEGFRFVTLDAIIYKNDLVRCMQIIVRRIQRVSKEQYDSDDTHLQFTKFESSDTKISSNENKVSRSSVHSSFDDSLSWAPTSTTARTSTDRQQAITSDVNDDNCLQSVVENLGHEFEVFSDENTCIVLKTPHTVESSGKIFCPHIGFRNSHPG
ncbi:hypothetical protein DPMN_073076 [Dreissena polymorpha]|uniref:t-SNARE coiled-coil homology domain-containing protein n=1 Tax=Dreissena polymorpha TaxID=45954 RepID=A0A9D4BYE9_DREPO|nr:hypothetical protein DPMN_073076 [Dreissena polymorpha]